MLDAYGPVWRLLQSNARLLASIQPWLRTAVSCRSCSSTCDSQGPTGCLQDLLNPASVDACQPSTATAAAGGTAAALQPLQQHSNCNSGGPAVGQPLQQEPRHATKLLSQQAGCVHPGSEQSGKRTCQDAVVTPHHDSQVWNATFYGNVPEHWWRGASSIADTPAHSSSTVNNSSSSSSGIYSIRSSVHCSELGHPSDSNGTSSAKCCGMVSTWSDLVQRSSSLQEQFRFSEQSVIQPYWQDGQLHFGRQPMSSHRIGMPCPGMQPNRIARGRRQPEFSRRYLTSNAGIRVAYAYRQHQAARQRQRQRIRQAQQQQRQEFTQLLQSYNKQVSRFWPALQLSQQEVDPMCPNQRQRLLQRHKWQWHGQQEQSAAALAGRLWRLACQMAAKQKQQQQSLRFWLRSHVSLSAAAVATSAEITQARKRLLPVRQLPSQAFADSIEVDDMTGPVPAYYSDIPRIYTDEVLQQAEQYAKVVGHVSRCLASRDEHGRVLPLPRDCRAGHACSSSDCSFSSISGTVQQHRRSACVAGVGCDAMNPRGRKRGVKLLKVLNIPRPCAGAVSAIQASTCTVEQDCPTVSAACAAPPAIKDVPTPADKVTEWLQQNSSSLQQAVNMPDPDSCVGSDGMPNFVLIEYCETDSESDWDSDDECEVSDSEYESDCEDDSDNDDDDEDEDVFDFEVERAHLPPEVVRVFDEPHVFRNGNNIIYGFWSKCPLG